MSVEKINFSVPFNGPIDSGIIWGMDFGPGKLQEVTSCDSPPMGSFRWLHLNLAHNGARNWIEHAEILPRAVREVLLSQDMHQRALVDGDVVCCVLQDFQRDFEVRRTDRIGTLRFALTPDAIITARLHPLGSADIVRRQAYEGVHIDGPATALDLLVSAIVANIDRPMREISVEVQASEDSLLAGYAPPPNRKLLEMWRHLARFHRMLEGMQRVFVHLEEDDDLSPALLPTVEKLIQRLQSLDSDALGVQGQLRLLREEVDFEFNRRINQNLYMLSIMTALMLPTTVITGIFGMNTGDLPFTGTGGTFLATLLVAGSALATYLFLRHKGFFR